MKKILTILFVSMCGIAMSAPVCSMLGAQSAIARTSAKVVSDCPYAIDKLLCIYYGKDWDGSKISPRYGRAPALTLSSGTIEVTESGLMAVGGTAILKSDVVQPVVDVFMGFSYGNDGEVSFEFVEDWTTCNLHSGTTAGALLLQFQTSDSVSNEGNSDWVMAMMRHTANYVFSQTMPFISSTFRSGKFTFDRLNNIYFPTYLGLGISKSKGVSACRKIFGYHSAYTGRLDGDFYARSYDATLRNRFIKNGYFKIAIQNGVVFNRLGCWLKKLSDAEISQNQGADVVEFGFTE